MRLTIFAVLFVVMFGMPLQAASLAETLRATIAAGKLEEINRIAAANPEAHEEIALALLAAAAEKSTSNPDEAGKLFQASVPFVGDISEAFSTNAVSYMHTVLALTKDANLRKENPSLVRNIFTAAMAMFTHPNISNVSVELQADTARSSQAFLVNAPPEDKSKAALPAQMQTIPSASPAGALAPSAD